MWMLPLTALNRVFRLLEKSNGPDFGRFNRQISSGGYTTITDLFLDLWVLAFPSRQGCGRTVLMLDNKTFMAMIALEQINALCLLRFRPE
jgi:hypothetical protein